jgi:hypothetical protein
MEPPLGDKGHRLQSLVNRNIPQIAQMYREHLTNLLKDLGRFMIVVLCVFDGFHQGKIVRLKRGHLRYIRLTGPIYEVP